MIYVIEVPHQMPPSVWSASNEQELIARICAVIDGRRDGDVEYPKTLETAIEYIRHDAHGVHVYKTDSEALEALRDGIGGHQGGKAHSALRKALERTGLIDSNGLTDEANALAHAIWREQVACGIGTADELEDGDLQDWLGNRVYGSGLYVLNAAAAGDVSALAEVRTEAGLPLLA